MKELVCENDGDGFMNTALVDHWGVCENRLSILVYPAGRTGGGGGGVENISQAQ